VSIVTVIVIYLHQGEVEQAIRIAQKALHIEPSSVHLRRELASLTLQQGNTNTIHAMIDVCSLTHQDEAKGTLPLAAIACNSKGGAALRYAQKAIMLDPANIQSWKVLAYIRARDANL